MSLFEQPAFLRVVWIISLFPSAIFVSTDFIHYFTEYRQRFFFWLWKRREGVCLILGGRLMLQTLFDYKVPVQIGDFRFIRSRTLSISRAQRRKQIEAKLSKVFFSRLTSFSWSSWNYSFLSQTLDGRHDKGGTDWCSHGQEIGGKLA